MSATCTIYSIPAILSYYYLGSQENAITKTENYRVALDGVRARQAARQARSDDDDAAPKHLEKPVSIIIPNYMASAALEECISAVAAQEKVADIETIIVDNNSDVGAKDAMRRASELLTNRKVVELPVNYGFTFAVNEALKIAEEGRDVLILNNDAVLCSGSLQSMQAMALRYPDCGIVVPQQLLRGGERTIPTHCPEGNGDFECDVSISAHHQNVANVPCFHDGEVVELTFAPFFCVYVKRAVIDELDGLDAEFGRHYRSDRVFCNVVRKRLGMKVLYCPESRVYHLHQVATQELRRASEREYNDIYRENRWPEDLRAQLGFREAPWMG
jgi:GT2 family glycosyltransferase